MKHLLYLLTALLFVPVSVNAQDDMYFTPKKQKKTEQVVKEQKSTTPVTELKTYDKDDVIYNGTGRLSDAKVDTIYAGEAMPNDTLYIDEYDTFEDGNGGRWINGFKGSVDDYRYAFRNMNWRSMRSAIPVGSSAYWNLTFGAASFDWNIYEVGGLAYLFPTWSNPLYWDYRISPSWGFWGRPWSWSYSPWHYGSYYAWGMYDPWYDPFYVWSSGGWGWGYSWHGIGHYHYAFDPIRRNPGRSAATYTIGGRGYHIGDRGNVASRNRSEAGTRGQVHRIQDRAAARSAQGSRVTGRSVRSTNDGSRSVNSVRPSTGSRSQMDAGSRGTATRSTSSYSRGADGRNSTYSRPSSTRVSTARNSERGSMNRASSVRSVNGSSRGSVSMDRMGSRSSSNSGASTRSSGSYSGSSSRSSVGSFSSGGGSRGGGSFSGGGSSSGGSRSGGGGRR